MTDEYEYAHLDAHEPFDEQQGIQQCPGCGGGYSGNGLYWGRVVDTSGNEYDTPGDASVKARLYHPSCYKEHHEKRGDGEVTTLADFTGGA